MKNREKKKTKDIEKFHGKVKSIREFDSKIDIKEEIIYKKNLSKSNRFTRTEMINNRRNKENEYNQQHFRLKIKGVHGGEIPLFQQTNKEWWKLRDSYKVNPRNTSHIQLQQDNKFWSRNDPILLADFSSEEGPLDAFKVHFKVESKKHNIASKPTDNKWFKTNKNVKKTKSNSIRWSDKEGKFKNHKCRIFDKLEPAAPQRADFDPLFSSFAKNGVFIPPPNSKEWLERNNGNENNDLNKSNGFKAKRSSHLISGAVSESFNGRQWLVEQELNMFKRVQSSYGPRKSDFKMRDANRHSEIESTRLSTHIKGKRALSIRSGAFRL